jgi:uncharacterized membrane protein YfcA
MPVEYLTVVAVIAILSVVQSIFGMGILVFGTPTLLLMGYDFATTLGYLLPGWFAFSLLQVLGGRSKKTPVSAYLYFICLPAIVAGFWLIEYSPLGTWTNMLIGLILIASAIVRIWSYPRSLLHGFLKRNSLLYHLIMGLVHGLTNLGGSFLAILASGISMDKTEIRYTVAHYYLAFSTVQLIFMILTMDYSDILFSNLPMAGLSAFVFFVIGNRFFFRTSERVYNVALTIFMAVYGAFILIEI